MPVETRHYATPLYGGILFSEPGTPVRIDSPTSGNALSAVTDDGRWFAIEVKTQDYKSYASDDGEVVWQTLGKAQVRRIYKGEIFTPKQIEAVNDDGKLDILLRNCEHNNWNLLVKTRAGNWQPLEPEDEVLPA